jgi:transposase-like protein
MSGALNTAQWPDRPLTCGHHNVLPVRPRSSTPYLDDCLTHLYVCCGMSTYRIAGRLDVNRQQVNQWLRDAGIPLRPRGAGGKRPPRQPEPENLPALLSALYVDQRLSSVDISRLLAIPERRIRHRLAEYGIRRRNRGGRSREDRLAVPRATLLRLYVAGGMTAEAIARLLAMSRATVLRTAHDLGLAVRVGGPPSHDGPTEIRLIDALYADVLVRRALRRHRIPEVRAGQPIWRRFPQQVDLSREALAELYADCGLSTQHIELLSGIPSMTVGRRLRAIGVGLRSPGGRSPFLQRWRALS